MHVLVATDGSTQSLEAARYLRRIVDPSVVTRVGVVAITSPLAAVPFAAEGHEQSGLETSFRRAAEAAAQDLADALAGWGPPVRVHVYSGSPATEIVKAAKRFESGLVVLASRSGRAQAALLGSVAHKVMTQAPCPVLVHRPGPKPKRSRAAR
jgi:nucleotide-binding universal stress UspA family protein